MLPRWNCYPFLHGYLHAWQTTLLALPAFATKKVERHIQKRETGMRYVTRCGVIVILQVAIYEAIIASTNTLQIWTYSYYGTSGVTRFCVNGFRSFHSTRPHSRTKHSALGTGSTKVQKQCVIWRNASFTRCVCSIRRSYAEESRGRSETTVKRLERYTSATRPHCFRSETLRRGILCANNEAPLFFWFRNWRPIMRTWMTGSLQNA